jgi:Arc/MetJ family transcription regulator
MRITVEIDNELMAQAQSLTGIQSKSHIVEEALRLLIQMRKQALVRELRGQLTWEGNLPQSRTD